MARSQARKSKSPHPFRSWAPALASSSSSSGSMAAANPWHPPAMYRQLWLFVARAAGCGDSWLSSWLSSTQTEKTGRLETTKDLRNDLQPPPARRRLEQPKYKYRKPKLRAALQADASTASRPLTYPKVLQQRGYVSSVYFSMGAKSPHQDRNGKRALLKILIPGLLPGTPVTGREGTQPPAVRSRTAPPRAPPPAPAAPPARGAHSPARPPREVALGAGRGASGCSAKMGKIDLPPTWLTLEKEQQNES